MSFRFRFAAISLITILIAGWLVAQAPQQDVPGALQQLQETLKRLQAEVKSLQETVKRQAAEAKKNAEDKKRQIDERKATAASSATPAVVLASTSSLKQAITAYARGRD